MACLKIQFVQMVPRRTHWYVLAANLTISLLAFFGLKLLAPEQRDLALAGFFVGVMPTATTAAVVVSFLHGRVSYAVTGFIITKFRPVEPFEMPGEFKACRRTFIRTNGVCPSGDRIPAAMP